LNSNYFAFAFFRAAATAREGIGCGRYKGNFYSQFSLYKAMNTFQANFTVDDSAKLVLLNLPFPKGERVHVVVESERDIRDRQLRDKKRASDLFQKIAVRMDRDAQFQALTEEDVAKEIAAYRRGE
jgi:hypothetical protein